MRASQSGLTGAAGQAVVEAQFVRLNWGVARNPMEHDLGTDLWLMARDARRYDLGAMVGAQVKSGKSWFASPERDDAGEVVGWWFADRDGEHFKHWRDHNVPHILVLHDPSTDTSYWVETTSERMVSTGKGSKILVPASSTVDEAQLDDLLRVALRHREPARWEGSAFEDHAILGSDRLRYAMLTPRLIAPHPNRGVSDYSPDQAIAALVKMRLNDLVPSPSPYRQLAAPDVETCQSANDWRWRFYAALYGVLVEGDDETRLCGLVDDVDAAPHQRVAAAAAAAALLMESHRSDAALTVVEAVLADDDSSPVDHAWLTMHRARVLVQRGELQTAAALALEVQSMTLTAPNDPTATALAGAAADLVFDVSEWVSRDVGDAVTGRDTLAAWWRTQEVAWALQCQADKHFKAWTGDRSTTWGASDQTWLRLRTASLIAGFTADQSAWRMTAAMLARHAVSTGANVAPGPMTDALTLMRVAGDHKGTAASIRQLLQVGPVEVVQRAASVVDLDAATRTSLHADMVVISEAADVLSAEVAARHAQWALGTLANSSTVARLSAGFVVGDLAVAMLAALVPALDRTERRHVINHLVAIPAVSDQAMAHEYAKVMDAVPSADWSGDDVQALARRNSDNFELSNAIEEVLAQSNSDRRDSLRERIARGDLTSLQAFGDLTDLDADTVVGLVVSLTDRINEEVAALKSGRGTVGVFSFTATLVMVNCWHPERSSWPPVYELLAATTGFTRQLRRPLENLRVLGARVPQEAVRHLDPILRSIMMRRPHDIDSLIGNPDVRGDAAAALEAMSGGAVTNAELWDLLRGSVNQRVGATQVVSARRRPESLSTLAALSSDHDPWVRAVVANKLIEWIDTDVAADSAADLLARILDADGSLVARMVTVRLKGSSMSPRIDAIAERLQGHASVTVRRQATEWNSSSEQSEQPRSVGGN